MQLVDWPKFLATELAEKRCILFLGAGVSMAAKTTEQCPQGFKSWEGFINSAKDELVKNKDHLNNIESFIESKNFLLALQAIRTYSDDSDYITFLNSELNKALEPSDLHEAIYDLDARIILTTNFDKVFESVLHRYHSQSSGFHIVDYSSESLIDNIRSNDILLIRAHGNISNHPKMIFTKEEYLKAKKEHPFFYKTLQALFLTNTVLFIGCSLTDPDILLVLEELKELGKYSKTHYCTVLDSESNEIIETDLLKSYNVKTLKYGPTHDALTDSIKSLVEMKNAHIASKLT